MMKYIGTSMKLPEDEEQDVIESQEDAVDSRLQHQHPGEVLLHPMVNPITRPKCQQADDRSDQQHGEADAVDAELILIPTLGIQVARSMSHMPRAGCVDRNPDRRGPRRAESQRRPSPTA